MGLRGEAPEGPDGRPARAGPAGLPARGARVLSGAAGAAWGEALVTGASSGIGRLAAIELARRGVPVVVHGRDVARTEAAAEAVRAAAAGDGSVRVVLADLSVQAEVRRLAEQVLAPGRPLRALVNNAGAVFGARELTPDGIERTWALNHLAPFLLTARLLPRLREAGDARVITVASGAHRRARIRWDDLSGERDYAGWRAYKQSKLANVLFTAELARRVEGSCVTALCLDPGVVATGFGQAVEDDPALAARLRGQARGDASVPARTLAELMAAAPGAGRNGAYVTAGGGVKTPDAAARDIEVAARLWEVSAEAVGEG